MVARGAKESPKTIPSEIQGGRPLHFLRVLSRCTLLDTTSTLDARAWWRLDLIAEISPLSVRATR